MRFIDKAQIHDYLSSCVGRQHMHHLWFSKQLCFWQQGLFSSYQLQHDMNHIHHAQPSFNNGNKCHSWLFWKNDILKKDRFLNYCISKRSIFLHNNPLISYNFFVLCSEMRGNWVSHSFERETDNWSQRMWCMMWTLFWDVFMLFQDLLCPWRHWQWAQLDFFF